MFRFAPSPTGDMHIGNLRVAIFNYILSKQYNSPFLVRIEDTDIVRNINGKDKEILAILNLFGLFWDKLVYQSNGFNNHRILAKKLIEQGKAFYCYCTKDFLEKKRQEAEAANIAFRYDDLWSEECRDINNNPSIRIKRSAIPISFIDEIKGECKFNVNELDSFVIIREDSVPTYNFACSVDDMIYDIDFIIRGEDHTSNTPKQILVRNYLGYDKNIKYAHLPMILNAYGKKMSKRDNESSVKWLLDEGYLPQAIANYLISMGNNPKDDIFTIKEALNWFNLKSISKSPARFDINQLRYINREHFKRLNESDIALLLGSKDLNIGSLAKIYLEESSTLSEIRNKFNDIFYLKRANNDFKNEINVLAKLIINLLDTNDSSLNDFNTFKNRLAQLSKLNGKSLFHPLRFILTGSFNGPLLGEIYPYLRFYLKDILKLIDV